jgi:hypothetical protein
MDTRPGIHPPEFHDHGRLRPLEGPEVSAINNAFAIIAVLLGLFLR